MTRTYRLVLLASVAVWLLGGCAVLGLDSEVPEESLPEADVVALADHGMTLTGMPAWAQRMELAEAEASYEQDPGIASGLRLALLLALADTELQDLARARVLLDTTAGAAEHPEDQGLNQLLTMLIAELIAGRERREVLEAAPASSREESLRRDQVRHLEALLAAEREQCRALEDQLNSLKEIERRMNERERPRSLPLDEDDPTQDTSGG